MLITVSILSVLVIFIFRALNTCLRATRFSQNINTACLLAELKLWEAELGPVDASGAFTQSGAEELNGKTFSWDCDSERLDNSNLLRLSLKTSWEEKTREQEYSFEVLAYFYKEPGDSLKNAGR